MKAIRITPESELKLPITLQEVREQLNFDPDDTSRDALLTELMVTATSEVELFTGLQLMQAEYQIKSVSVGSGMAIPVAPVVGVAGISYLDVNGVSQTIPADQYHLEQLGIESILHVHATGLQFSNKVAFPVTINLTAGFGVAGSTEVQQRAIVPSKAKRAILMKVASWFEKREDHYSNGAMKASDLILVPICRNFPG
jgi:uncharacterized phiE125 gp8 family phage protein